MRRFVTMVIMVTVTVATSAAGGRGCVTTTGPIYSGDDRSVFTGLRPQDAEFREQRALDGVWQFRLTPAADPNAGFRDKWFAAPLRQTAGDDDSIVLDMPVPASYNDITEQKEVRDYVGWAWYSTETWVPRSWSVDRQQQQTQPQRVVLRCGSAHYTAIVYVNNNQVTTHSGGHLPFAADVTDVLRPGERNLITIAVNNTLTDVTVPQGQVVYATNSSTYIYPAGYNTLQYKFDFFNYAGIHRPVLLYTTPATFVEDVVVISALRADSGADVTYDVSVGTRLAKDTATVNVTLLSPDGRLVATSAGNQGTLTVAKPQLWWPYLMDKQPGRQYTLEVRIAAQSGAKDVYRQKFGIREFKWTNAAVTVNGRPLYIRGFGKHEDSDIRGKGLDMPTVIKDFNLIEWVGANCFRTSHYPYAEEIMDAADERGILVIDEVPAVSLDYSATGLDDRLLTQHLADLEGLIARDKNRPGVFMWSLSNEAKTSQTEAVPYYQQLINLVRTMDATRPVTAVLNTDPLEELIAPLLDVVCVNRYFGWYSDTGHTDLITEQAVHFFNLWRSTFTKPVINSEYGADTVVGLHTQPEFVFSEEYQVQLMRANFHAFDLVREHNWFLGEMIWNFADFMTKQDVTRVVGNKKGIFTRQRQPKMSAHLLRSRYWQLVRQIDNPDLDLPSDLMFSSAYTAIDSAQCHLPAKTCSSGKP